MRHSAKFCNHYRAMSEHETCKAGVAYETFKGMPFERRPCFRRDKNEAVRPGCEHVQFPTPEQLDAAEKEMNERFANLGKARAAIVESLGGPWKRGMPGSHGRIDCPVCCAAKSLNFSRSSYNGHIHAKCDTDGCVCWME